MALSRWLVLAAALAACGDNLAVDPPDEPVESLAIVGHSDLGARGMNAALAVIGDTVYVGSRIDQRGVAIVDVSDPARPAVVGELGLPDEGLPSMSSRELRVVPELDLLIVLNLACSPGLHGCADRGGEFQNLKLYDIGDRRAPVLLSRYDIVGTLARPRAPHEFYVWRGGGRVLVFVATPPGPPGLEVIDVTDPRAPVRVTSWDATEEGLVRPTQDAILHSIGISDDGGTAYLSHQQAGLLLADTSALPAITLRTPPAAALRWPPLQAVGPHSAVRVPGRDVLVVTEEIYPMPFGTGCPWGHLRTVDIADPAAPRQLGEYKLPENDPGFCGTPHERTAFTAHNATVTHDLALVTWYAGGLQAIDLSDPAAPRQLVELRPAPLPAVAVEDPGLGGHPVAMWSYPVVQDGLIYVVDIRNGLYILRYEGKWAAQLDAQDFLEGNSNL